MILTPLKFAAGALGNLVSQTGRGFANFFWGILCSFVGAGQSVLSVVQRAGGGKKTAKNTFSKAKSNLLRGAKGIFRGVVQLCASWALITPILRGAQLVSEPVVINGIYAPGGRNRTWVQNLMGLNSWDGEEKLPRVVIPLEETFAPPIKIERIAIKETCEKVSPKIKIESRQIQSKPKLQKAFHNPELESLVAAYRTATSSYKRNSSPSRILATIAIKYPRYYRSQQNKAWRKPNPTF